MEFNSHSVPNKFPDYGTALTFGIILDCPADVPQPASRANLFHAPFQAFSSHAYDLSCIFSRVSHKKSLVHVGIVPVQDGGNIHINNIPIFQDLFPGDTVTDHLINGNTDTFRIPPIIQGSGDSPVLHRECMDSSVDIFRRHTNP